MSKGSRKRRQRMAREREEIRRDAGAFGPAGVSPDAWAAERATTLEDVWRSLEPVVLAVLGEGWENRKRMSQIREALRDAGQLERVDDHLRYIMEILETQGRIQVYQDWDLYFEEWFIPTQEAADTVAAIVREGVVQGAGRVPRGAGRGSK